MINLLKGFNQLFKKKEMSVPSSETFVETVSMVVPAGGRLDLFALTVPPKCSARLLGFGNTCGTLLAWGTVYWTILVDGTPVYPYLRILDQLGFETGRQSFKNIDIPGGHVLTIRAYNPTAADCKLGMSLEYVLFYVN